MAVDEPAGLSANDPACNIGKLMSHGYAGDYDRLKASFAHKMEHHRAAVARQMDKWNERSEGSTRSEARSAAGSSQRGYRFDTI